ncbi:MAG: methyltransferase [Verrucomicrobiota bacterium]
MSSQEDGFWEGRYQDGDTPWDKGEAAPPLIEYLSRNQITGSVCVPGCGVGYDVRALAAQGAAVIGFDIAPSALAKATSLPTGGDEQYRQIDWFNLPDDFSGHFNYVFEHTCFCAIDPSRRMEYVESCLQALKPGGQLLAIFFMTPDAEEGPPFGTTVEELDSLFSHHFDLIHDEVPTVTYSGREGRERLRLLRKL